jgi:hypothetical protein
MFPARFVILEHDHPNLHWDFMLENDGVLQTWRLPAAPRAGEMVAEQIADHRLAYLDYEGPVSGGRGVVKRWDGGTYRPAAAGSDALDLNLWGQRLRARVQMNRVNGTTWQTIWHLDLITDAETPSS